MSIKANLNGFTLKLIACITMAIDHFAVLFLNPQSMEYLVARILGRVAFPIFAFLLVEGFFHSSNLKKYILRLTVLAVLSEPLFDYFIIRTEIPEFYTWWYTQNVVFTLLIGLITIWAYDTVIRRFRSQPILSNTYCVLILLSGAMLSFGLRTDYPAYGVMIIFIMYLFHKNRVWMSIATAAAIILFGGTLQLFQMAGIFLIWLYNGEEGKKVQPVFYLFYPLHILLLGVLHMIIK